MTPQKKKKAATGFTVRPGSQLDRMVKMAQAEIKKWPQWMKDLRRE